MQLPAFLPPSGQPPKSSTKLLSRALRGQSGRVNRQGANSDEAKQSNLLPDGGRSQGINLGTSWMVVLQVRGVPPNVQTHPYFGRTSSLSKSRPAVGAYQIESVPRPARRPLTPSAPVSSAAPTGGLSVCLAGQTTGPVPKRAPPLPPAAPTCGRAGVPRSVATGQKEQMFFSSNTLQIRLSN